MAQQPYTVVFSTSNTSGLRHVFSSITIAGTMLKCVALPLPPRGRLHTLAVRQTTGSNNASIKLFASVLPFPTGEQAVATAAAVPEVLYQIIAAQAYTAGSDLFYTNDTGRPYANLDVKTGAFAGNALYLVIVPTGAGSTTVWDVTVTVTQDSPN